MTAVEAAEFAGFDLSLIEASLSCSYEERAVHHQAALDLALELEAIGRRLREDLLAVKELRAIREKNK